MKYLLTVWSTGPEDYFLIQNTINHLSKIGSKTHLIYKKKIKKKSEKNIFHKSCKRYEIFSSKNKLLDKLYFLYYLFYLIFFTLFLKPNKIILYNNKPIISIFFIKFFFKGKIIYHNFDYDPSQKALTERIFNFFERKFLKYFDLLIFPDEKRAKFFKKKFNLDKKKIVFMYNSLPLNYFGNYKKKFNNKNKKIFRIGSIGPGHGLKNLIKSFKFLDSTHKLYLYGNVVDFSYFNDLKTIITKFKLQKKIKIKTSVSVKVWKKQIKNSALGVALFEKNNISHQCMPGAHQKVNAYLCAGIPFIAANESLYRDFKKKYNCCIVVDIKSPENIAKVIKKIFIDETNYSKLKLHSYEAFLNEFNFEKQLEKVKHYL